MQDLRKSALFKKTEIDSEEKYMHSSFYSGWVTNLFQKGSNIGNQKFDHQIALIAIQNVYWNTMDTGETQEGEYKVSWADFQSSVTLSYLQNITLQIYTYVVRYAYL